MGASRCRTRPRPARRGRRARSRTMSRSRSQNQNQTLGFAQCQAWKPRTIAVASRGLIHRARCAGRTGVRLAAALGRRSPAGRRGVPRVCPAQARLRPAAEGGGLSLAQSGPARASVTAPLSAGRQRAAPHTLPCRLGDGHGGGRRAGGWGHSARAGEPAAAVGAGVAATVRGIKPPHNRRKINMRRLCPQGFFTAPQRGSRA